MATDPVVALREVLVELRGLRVRINRQIAAVERALRPPKRPKAAARSPGARPAKPAAPRGRTAGYAQDRQALARRLSKKPRR